jgi:hypothetical protein
VVEEAPVKVPAKPELTVIPSVPDGVCMLVRGIMI